MGEWGLEHPWVLAGVLLFWICGRYCPPRLEALLFPHLDYFGAGVSRSGSWLRIMKWVAIILALIALASPVRTNRIEIDHQKGYAIALLLDASGSMRLGFGSGLYRPRVGSVVESKFKVTQEIANDFIQRRKHDAIALVVFGNYAYIASPLTYDKRLLSTLMRRLYAGIAGSNYTVIYDALFQSTKLFEHSSAKSKIAILLTDGESRGDHIPYDIAMRAVKDQGIKLYTIGIGRKGDFDADFLQKIARQSGGKMFQADSKAKLAEVYRTIDRLEKSDISATHYIQKRYYYEYPLFFAFLALLFYAFLLNKRGSV